MGTFRLTKYQPPKQARTLDGDPLGDMRTPVLGAKPVV